MFNILRSAPKEPQEFIVKSREGWVLTLLPPGKDHKACRFTDAREAAEVAAAMSGRRRHFANYEVVEVIPNDPRYTPPKGL